MGQTIKDRGKCMDNKPGNDIFEKEFGSFLESKVYDRAESSLFALVRAAFTAGWRAAGGEEIIPEEILSLVPKNGSEE